MTIACCAPLPERRFLIRTSCEYAVEVEAESAEEALEKASRLVYDEHWTQSWAPFEVDEDYPG